VDTKKITEIFSRLKKQAPNPKSELVYNTPFELLIAVILSAQATDSGVNKATEKLFIIANTPEKILELGEERLKDHIKTINLYQTKAKHIIKTCQLLIENFSSSVPNNRQSLQSLPGVGPKTANVILNNIFKQPVIAVDTHVFRVANRTQIAPGKNPAAVEKKLLDVIPNEFLLHAHHWLILHGRYTCIARKPLCKQCVIYDLCEYKDKVL